MKYFSMFSGIGTAEKGIEQAYESVYHTRSRQELRIETGDNRWMPTSGESDQSAISRDNSYLRVVPADRLDSPRSTSTHQLSTDTIGRKSETMEMQPHLFQMTSTTLTFSSRDFLARVSVLLENDRDLMKPEALCFLRSHGFYHTSDRDIFYSKTLKACLVLTMEKCTRQYLGFSPISTTVWRRLCLTASTSEFRRTGKECSLSDILETNVAEKYFLSETMMANLMGNMDKLKTFQAASTPTTTKETQMALADYGDKLTVCRPRSARSERTRTARAFGK